MNTLHIYGQENWHDEVYIVGTHAALKDLWLTIGEVLHSGKEDTNSGVNFYTNDGEGYTVYLFRVPEKELNTLCVPYTSEEACASEKDYMATINVLLDKQWESD